MLQLAVLTDPAWAREALPHVDEILLEQAHLEKKAAAAALSYLFRYPSEPRLQQPLAALVREELSHFELVLQHLARRGVPFGPQPASQYAAALRAAERASEPDRLLDRLLCSALIEARSCERMQLLGAALRGVDDALASLYEDLVASEARHHGVYLRLARGRFPPAEVDRRWRELARHEAEVVSRLPRAPRLHT